MKIIDAHIHCGIQHTSPDQSFSVVQKMLDNAGVHGAVCFPPVAEIYDRMGKSSNSEEWWQTRRQNAREYVCSLREDGNNIYPFYFVWNDFDISMLDRCFGIKWHRHEGEPEYHYDDPQCEILLNEIKARKLPMIIEEEYHHMHQVIERIDGESPIIIPHLGEFNGGCERLMREDLWKHDNVYADISWEYLPTDPIETFLHKYGPEKIMYGSDFPFGDSGYTKEVVQNLKLSNADKELIFSGNILRLMNVEE